MTLLRICPTLFFLGVAFMIPFEEWYTRLLGMTCLVGFVVTGLFLIASPEFLSKDTSDGDPPAAGGRP